MTFNEYLVDNTTHKQTKSREKRCLATGVHRLLVQNPGGDNCLASWYGVRLRVRLHRWTPLTRNEQGVLTRRPLVFDEFSVMFDPRESPDNFLWNLATARLPFDEWGFIDLCVGHIAHNNGWQRTWRLGCVGGPPGYPGQIWRVWPREPRSPGSPASAAAAASRAGPPDFELQFKEGKRQRDDDSEQAARDGLNEVQKVATKEAQDDSRVRERYDEVLGVHRLDWCLDVVAKQEPIARRSQWAFFR